jgi:hypothetical protein
MSQRWTNGIEIVVFAADAHALLRGRGAHVITLFSTEKHVLELIHPGVGEQQRRIVSWNEGRAGNDAVSVTLEVLQEGRADLVGVHPSILPIDLGTSFSQPRVDRMRIEALADETADDASGSLLIQLAGIGAFQPPIDRRLEKCRLIDLAEDLVDGLARSLGIDAEPLNLLQHAPAAAPLDTCTQACRGERDATIVQRPVADQSIDNAIDFLLREAAAEQPVAQLPIRQLASTEQRERRSISVHVVARRSEPARLC